MKLLKIVFVYLALSVVALPGYAETQASAVPAPQVEQVSGGVNINTASVAELAEGLNGIGVKKAEAIVSFRNQYGPFKTVAELAQVKGIGESTLERNAGKIRTE